MFQPGEQISKVRFEKLVQDHITALQRLLLNEQNTNAQNRYIELVTPKSINLHQEVMALILKLTQDSNAQFIVEQKACAIPFLLEAGQGSPRPLAEIFFD